MNGYELIMRLQKKMQSDPGFAANFNQKVNELGKIPGLQQEVIRISQIPNEKKRQQAINRLPDNVKSLVNELITMING